MKDQRASRVLAALDVFTSGFVFGPFIIIIMVKLLMLALLGLVALADVLNWIFDVAL